jgi:undecaprenyl diphosphate synthase
VEEVNGLMSLLVSTIKKELPTLQKNNIRLKSIGNIGSLPADAQENLDYAKKATQFNDGLTLILALNYSGRWELSEAVKKIAQDVAEGNRKAEDVSESMIEAYLDTRGMPDPELLIRTSGEMRISNFLLWQIAYTELYITEVLWPDFRREHLYEAIVGYQRRERRFGKISEQVNS